MPSDQSDIIGRLIEALSCANTRAVVDDLDPEFEWVPHVAGFTVREPYRGARGLRDWCRLARAMLKGYSLELDGLEARDGRIVATVRQSGRSRATRAAVDETLALVCEFRDGKVVRARAYPRIASAAARTAPAEVGSGV